MPVDLHFICKQQRNHRHVEGSTFETWEWKVSTKTADEAIGGRVYLHETHRSDAWHGGTVTGWRPADDGIRKVFTYVVDGPFRVRCRGNWGREKAIVRR